MSHSKKLCALDHDTVEELTELLLELIDFSKENNRKRIIYFVYGLLNSNEDENFKLAWKLIQRIRNAFLQFDSTELLQMFFDLMRTWTRDFPKDEKLMLHQIWSINLNSTDQSQAVHIILQIFQDFLNDQKNISVFTLTLHARILELLKSSNNIDCSAGSFLRNKLLDINIEVANEKHVENDDSFNDLHFFSYITIMQCLKVEQLDNGSHNDKHGLIWMRPLYIRLLKEDNLLVLRWTIEYFMEHITLAELRRANLLIDFLTATNRLELHDLENYFLPEQQMKKFIPQLERKQFLLAFSRISWHEVPLFRWLHCMELTTKPQITHKLLLQISAQVKRMLNPKLRKRAIEQVFKLFDNTIKKLSLLEYLEFIESLYHDHNDSYADGVIHLAAKIKACKDISEDIVHLKRRHFEMICNNFPNIRNAYYQLMKQLKHIKTISLRGWWRLPILFKMSDNAKVLDFYHTEYDINIELFKKCTDLKKFQDHLLDKLSCKTDDEKLFVIKQSIDLFVKTNLKDWNQFEELHLSPHELLKNGTFLTFEHLADLLGNHKERLQDESILDIFLQLWKNQSSYHRSTRKILKYADKHLNIKQKEQLVEEMISSCNNNCETLRVILMYTILPKTVLIQELIREETTINEIRTQLALECCTNRRDTYIEYIRRLPKDDFSQILNELLLINRNIIRKHSTILENSEEHKTQLRIVRAILHSERDIYWSDNLWQALLEPSNPLNVCYLYECLVVRQESFDQSFFEVLMDKLRDLRTLQVNQQDSIISVIYIYCIRQWDCLKIEDFEKLFGLIYQQIMQLNKQTKLLMQWVLHTFKCMRSEMNSSDIPVETAMKIVSSLDIEDKDTEHLIKARLMLPDLLYLCDASDYILYITNAPADEYDCNVLLRVLEKPVYKQLRNAFKCRGAFEKKDDENKDVVSINSS